MENPLQDRVAIVSGGANGIGQTISQVLAQSGAEVFVLDIHPETAERCRKLDCVGYTCDISDKKETSRLINKIIADAKKIDILVNNAGIVRLGTAEDLSDEDWDATMNMNLRAHFQVCKILIPHMKQQRYGRIISISSQASIVALEGHIAYCASKAAIDGMTRVLALELGPYGITANTVAPTVIMTALGQKAWAGEKGEKMREKIPIRRFGEPQDVANAVLFLACKSSSLVNGHSLTLDGGYSIQ